jgi:hypothetical protein
MLSTMAAIRDEIPSSTPIASLENLLSLVKRSFNRALTNKHAEACKDASPIRELLYGTGRGYP